MFDQPNYTESSTCTLVFDNTPAGRKLGILKSGASKFLVEIWLDEVFDELRNPMKFFGELWEFEEHTLIAQFVREMCSEKVSIDHLFFWIEDSEVVSNKKLRTSTQNVFIQAIFKALRSDQ